MANLDELAGHHSIEEVYNETMHVVESDADIIHYEARGSVCVQLQWDSNSDFRKGDGAT
ncbi:MAG: hypothetical protein J2P49_02055 [Methylocapsa sp.]|nr:hypothetical protein [Methylocapsa sp.]